MQPPPLPGTQKVSYQLPRDIIIPILWRRTMFRPRHFSFLAFLALVSAACFVLRGGLGYVGVVFAVLVVLTPLTQYRLLAKAVDSDRVWTDPKTVEFSPSQIVATGPNWKTEMPWTRFQRFSEDAEFFYLEFSGNMLASVIPKKAFSLDQLEKFRQYAEAQIG